MQYSIKQAGLGIKNPRVLQVMIHAEEISELGGKGSSATAQIKLQLNT